MDVAVVGAGIVGLSTAFALVERGASVTVYERGVPGAAQSGGESRIFRHGHDDPRLVALAVEGRELWREWERRFGVELVSGDGVVVIGPAAERRAALLRHAGAEISEIAAHPLGEISAGRPREISAGRPRQLSAGRPRELSAGPPRELSAGPPRDIPAGFLDRAGGVIRTRAAVGALVAALGERIVADEVVAVGLDGSVRVGGANARHDRIVVCAGRDTALLARDLALPVEVSTHVRLTFPLRDGAVTPLPCLQDTRHGAYGDALPGNDRFAVGLGDDPDETVAYVARELPGLVPEPVEARNCWVTELPWGPDAMAVWETGPVLFFAGGNLFKHAPWIGRALAAAAVGTGVPDFLRPSAELGRTAGI